MTSHWGLGDQETRRLGDIRLSVSSLKALPRSLCHSRSGGRCLESSKWETCYQQTFGHRFIYAPRRFQFILRRTFPAEPVEPSKPVEPAPLNHKRGPSPSQVPLCLYFFFFFFLLSFLPFLCFLHFLTLAEMSFSSSGSVSSSPAGCISSSEISQSPSILSSPSGRPSV